MEEERRELEAVLEREKVILVDNCLVVNSFLDDSFDWKTYLDVDLGLVEEAEKEFQIKKDFLAEPKVFTTEEVYQEFSVFQKKYSNKQRYLNQGNNVLRKSLRQEYKTKITRAEEAMERLGSLVQETKQNLKGSICPIKERLTYQNLREIIIEFNYRGDLKKKQEEGKEDSLADESLVALGLYLSLGEKTSSMILTRDEDIYYLLKVPSQAMLENFYRPYNYILHYLDKYPVKVKVKNLNQGLVFSTEKSELNPFYPRDEVFHKEIKRKLKTICERTNQKKEDYSLVA